jgi:glycosyltransferase involved in cell wall biosynthesis
MSIDHPHIAYLSLQSVVDGQDTWAAVTEVTELMEEAGWTVERYFVDYGDGAAPGGLRRVVAMWSLQRRLSKRLAGFDALYVRVHPLALPAARAAKRLGVPVIQECNGPLDDLFIAWPATRFARSVFTWMQRWQYRHASAVIAVAEGLSAWIRSESGNTRVTTVGNGADVALFTPDAPRAQGVPDHYAVFFGQFAPWQGIDTLLQATKLPEWPQALPLVFAGDGVMRETVERAAASHPERVRYVGKLPYLDVPGLVAHAAAAFIPISVPDTEMLHSPLKLYEAMACGVPVVASDTPGVSETVVEAACGVLVPPGDASAIARATADLLADPAASQAMGVRGREAAISRYSWPIRARQRMAVVEAAITRRRDERP